METIGEKIRIERLKRNLSQENLAAEIGISPNTLSEVENGRKSLKVDVLVKVAEVLKMNFLELLENTSLVGNVNSHNQTGGEAIGFMFKNTSHEDAFKEIKLMYETNIALLKEEFAKREAQYISEITYLRNQGKV